MYLHLMAVLLAALQGGMQASDAGPGSETVSAIHDAVCSEEGCDAWTGDVLAATAAEESRAAGGKKGDGGLARGRFQLHPEWWQGHTGDELDADAWLDARLARDAVKRLERHCHSRRGALAAYASGKCDQGLEYANRRCAAAGGC
jgi:hypothetical protein